MYKNPLIRSFFAGIMLIIFTFSITPKRLLHHLIATHEDDPSLTITPGTTHVHNAGFHCNCENLVAESPFIAAPLVHALKAPAVFSVLQSKAGYHFYTIHHFFAELRGPPTRIS